MNDIREITNVEEKIRIMKKCDDAFPIRLFERENCDEIINKIASLAIFLAAFAEVGEIQAVGYVAFYANDVQHKNAYISSIGVCNEMQGKHIGSRLMEETLKQAKKNGMKHVRLEVLKTNEKAIAFYKRWGFEFEQNETLTSYYMSRDIC